MHEIILKELVTSSLYIVHYVRISGKKVTNSILYKMLMKNG